MGDHRGQPEEIKRYEVTRGGGLYDGSLPKRTQRLWGFTPDAAG